MKEKITEVLYQCYRSRADDSNDTIRECFSLLDEFTKEMPFTQGDRICSAVCAACAECERLAFLDGVNIGAQLILELTGG
mgnify:CR=1 FL=1